MGWWHEATQNIMRNNVRKGCRTQGEWQLEHFKALMTDWQKRSTETINPKETSHFTFLPNARSHAIRALAVVLARHPPVFKVSMLQLCRYLSEHSNLGTPESIRQALYRVRKML